MGRAADIIKDVFSAKDPIEQFDRRVEAFTREMENLQTSGEVKDYGVKKGKRTQDTKPQGATSEKKQRGGSS